MCLIFDPISKNICPLDVQIAEILNNCNGKNSISQICSTLSNKHGISSLNKDDSINDILRLLIEKGFLEIINL
jgi:hypothetical protein